MFEKVLGIFSLVYSYELFKIIRCFKESDLNGKNQLKYRENICIGYTFRIMLKILWSGL